MHSSDTPETDTQKRVPDWSREIPSDDQLSQQARQKIAEVLRRLAEQGR